MFYQWNSPRLLYIIIELIFTFLKTQTLLRNHSTLQMKLDKRIFHIITGKEFIITYIVVYLSMRQMQLNFY